MAAEAAISAAVELLGDLLIQKVKFLRGVERKVELLQDELKTMQSFLIDANKKQAEDERVRDWISKIREVAQDAQDAIEIFHLKIENPTSMALLKRCTSFPKRMCHLHGIGDEIESIRARLDAIYRSREMYGIKDPGEATESAWRLQVESQRRLSPWRKDEHLVGMEDDVKKLLREAVLDGHKEGLSIAVIEGMGGIGKSTLAREIHNHPDVVAGGPFDYRGWVVVSSEFTPQETIKQLIFQLQKSEKEKQNLLYEMKKLEEAIKDKLKLQEVLIQMVHVEDESDPVKEIEESEWIEDKLFHQDLVKEMLHEMLKGKSYFIVLDDVWEKEHLESLLSAFPNEKDKTSRLLVTTRNKIIGKYTQYVHKMEILDLEESWELLLKKANFGRTNGKCPEELESIGRQIMKKCHGLPLAISVVGGLLMETQTKSGWEQVLNQINSYLGRAESRVSAILELSYQNLSPRLKSCFLCLAFFRKDSTISARSLVNIWASQGLIERDGSRTIDEIARGYLNELIDRSMVQIQDLTIDDRVKNCSLHDLVRDLCLRKAKEEIGFEIVTGEEVSTSGSSPSSSSYKPRHRAFYGENIETRSSKQDKHLRSLFLLNVNVNVNDSVYMTTPSCYWKSFSLLKTLYLDHFVFRRLPRSLRLMIGLKYLGVHKSYTGDRVELPSWLNRLKNLEVLDVKNEFVVFPDVALEMERLRHFHVRHVDGRPMKIKNWRSIETLRLIRVEDWMKCSSRLTAGCHLRELGIFIREICEGDDEFRRSLVKMKNLVKLHLKFNRSLSVNSIVIPQLDSLANLKLDGKILNYPAATEFPPNLSHLTLKFAEPIEDPMPELGKLPKLQYLKLSLWLSSRRMQVLKGGFPCLEALALKRMDELRGIDVEEGGMPRLKQLRIRDCPNLDADNLLEHIKSAAWPQRI
ncbi:disease resistance protein RPP8-like [Salvia miltiorrhiza]|uniref:disease resistance protein RPP8-like n=1 Tax=Salvia miltiorrhiza TaxID=226208 RepID=UPI0025AD3B94|nr:disease resistance protein RPP8-like [Salvia miltiorrhiza]